MGLQLRVGEELCLVLGDPKQPLGSLASDLEMQNRPEGKGYCSASKCFPGKTEYLLPWVPVNPAWTVPQETHWSMLSFMSKWGPLGVCIPLHCAYHLFM